MTHPPRSRARGPAAVAIVAGALVIGVVALFSTHGHRKAGVAVPELATFVGSERCGQCHEPELRAWRGSQHQRAMQIASPATVLGDFADARFTYAGTTSTFFRRDGRHYVRTDGPDGALADFEVRYTFGVYPMQQYLIELPRGRLQALSIAWDTRPAGSGGQRWFHLYPAEQIDHRNPLHWTGRQQNWNYMCADCHSTNLAKHYDATTDSYATSWSEISVGCEACHGPGSAHVAWAAKKRADPTHGLTVQLDERRGVSWGPDPGTGKPRRSVPRESQREIDVCAPCHSRRTQLTEGYRAGRAFTDHYLPALLEPALYHVDGQQSDEVYVWGSWLQSRMHRAGVTCSDCHDPHSQQLRAPGNAVCTQCHAAQSYDGSAHHRHARNSAGARCVACHMPETTYMVLDPRRDHSMRVPRPDQSVTLGVPNPCTGCHRDEGAAWAAAQVRGWLGRDAQGIETFASAFARAASAEPGAVDELARLADDSMQPPIVRASAVQRLAAWGATADPRRLERAVADPDVLVRLAAVSLGQAVPARERSSLAPLLDDPRRAVRIEAARLLADTQSSLPAGAAASWQRAADEYRMTLTYNADRPEAHVARGSFEASLGHVEQAASAFEAALELDPTWEPAYVNAADALRAQGREDAAMAMLQRGLQAMPQGASLHHALGLAQVRLQQIGPAVLSLHRAMELSPDQPRYTYVYAVALHSTGRPREAIDLLVKARHRWPGERDVGLALASFQLNAGEVAAARRTIEQLLTRFPDDPQVRALAAQSN